MADHDDELVDAVRELTATIDDLRAELESTQRRPRFRPPAPRPPTPREFLEFTDEVALPAAIAVLETSVRALEGFQRTLRLARTEREARDRTTEATRAAGERADDLRRSTLSRLDTVLAELQRAASDGTLPADEGARDLLSEARELRADVERRLERAVDDGERDATEAADAAETVRIDIEDGDPLDDAAEPDDDPEPNVDVDAELETLRDQYGSDDEDDASDAAGDGSSDTGSDEPDSDEDGSGGDDGATGDAA